MNLGTRCTPKFRLISLFQRRQNQDLCPQLEASRGIHNLSDISRGELYHLEPDVEDFEEYVPGGYHPTLIGDKFCSGRYTVVHKMGYGGYSTIWLAHDQQSRRYVSLKILTARASQDSHEGKILDLLNKSNFDRQGKSFIPPMLHQFSFHGPNGHHQCLVGEPAGINIAQWKEHSTNMMFPRDAARSATAQLLLGLSHLHANGVCHGDLHPRNFLLRSPKFDSLSIPETYARFGKPFKISIRRVDGKPNGPYAAPHAIYPLSLSMPSNELDDPEIVILDYGMSFIVAQTPSPTFYTPALYSPPEILFNESIIRPTAADILTLGVSLYETLGERPLFETFSSDPNDVIGEMINTLGRPPERWWDS